MRRTTFITLVLIFLALNAAAQTSHVTPAPSDTASGEKNLDLIKGIKDRDLVLILKLLDAGASPNAVADGTPALIWAVRLNRVDIAEILLARGANVDEEESDDGTALQTAAAAGRADLVKLLISHHAGVNHKDEGGHMPLLYAAFGAAFKSAPAWLAKDVFEIDENEFGTIGNEHAQIAKLLLDAGADVNSQAQDCGLTPLMVAAISGNVELAEILLARHADVKLSNGEWTALRFAEEVDPDLEKEIDETDERKQALLNWVQLTKPRRQTVAAMLRKAGAL